MISYKVNIYMDRRYSGSTQSIYLVKIDFSSPEELIFHVLGTSSKVYKITFEEDKSISCSCADFTYKKKICKHCYFVMDRVIRDYDITFDEIVTYLMRSPMYINPSLVQRYEEIQQSDPKLAEARNDSCCICFDDLGTSSIICNVCQNAVHKECFERWTAVNTKMCVYCRSRFVEKKDIKTDSLGNIVLQ